MSVDYNVLLFGPGLPSGGQLTQCRIDHDNITLSSHKQMIRFSELTAKVGGVDHNQLQLTWQHQNEDWTLIPFDANTQTSLIKALPRNAINGLGRWKRETIGQHLVWKSVVTIMALVGITAVLIVWQYDSAVSWVAGRVPLATEYKLGQSVLDSLTTQTTLVDKGLAIDAVKKIGDRLTQGSPYKYQWHVSNDSAINAFALPGGIVIVNQGLLEKADSPNQLAGVLAHEIQHVEQRHALKNMITSSGIAAAVLLLLGDANAVMMIMAHQVSTQYFSRQAESEADLRGIKLLTKVGIDPKGLTDFFKKLKSASKHKSDGPEWLSSHPGTQSRIDAIEAYLKKHPCAQCENLKWDKKSILASLPKDKNKSKSNNN